MFSLNFHVARTQYVPHVRTFFCVFTLFDTTKYLALDVYHSKGALIDLLFIVRTMPSIVCLFRNISM